jgi:hypothetical protein
MKFLKSYKIFESNDDADTMAKYQIFGAKTKLAFNFNREFIYDPDDIWNLIEAYRHIYQTKGGWPGGPPPVEFIELWNRSYAKREKATRKSWYPTIDLHIQTPDYGLVIIYFSVLTTKFQGWNWSHMMESRDRYDERVREEFGKIITLDISKLNIDEVIERYQLDIENEIKE